MSLLTNKIDEYINNNYSRFHSPAHYGYLGLRDLSEVEGLDDLQNPQGVLKETQEYIAQLFNSAQSFMLVNGASIGLQASCIALKIFLNCQKTQNQFWSQVIFINLQSQELFLRAWI